jgi:alpha-tubulin suppressor-like RCC1 family protein
MINSQNLIDKICSKISCGGLTSLESCQTTGSLNILSSPTVVSVTTCNDLPNANDYVGRMIYVNNENRYYYATSAGVWINNFESDVFTYASQFWSFGKNPDGQLGDNTVVNRSSPVAVCSSGITDWCQISAGYRHSLALRPNGTLWAWGNGGYGRLGTGDTVNTSSPVSVVGGFTDWCQISAGTQASHSAGIRTDGSLWTWGLNSVGQLGTNSTICRSSPVSVVGGFTWCRVSVGASHTVAIRNNGTAWAWGNNDFGQFGNGTYLTNRSSPVSVIGGFTDWCQIGAGNSHTVGLRTNGTLWSWGYARYGRLGNNTTGFTRTTSPVSVVGGFTDWCKLSVGTEHTIAQRCNGTLWGWGRNCDGRIGMGSAIEVSSPVSVVGGFTDWCQISAGFFTTVAVRTNGTLWSWGRNTCGALGNNQAGWCCCPTLVAGGFTDWTQASSGSEFAVGIRQRRKGF